MLTKLAFLLALSAAPVAAAAAPPPEARAPAGRWTVDFDDAQCVAAREYGTPESPLRLVVKAPPMGEVMQIGVLRAAKRAEAEQVEATIGVGGRPPVKTNMLMYSPKAGDVRVHLLNMTAADFAPLTSASTISIKSRGFEETFALSGMAPLLKVLGECVADLKQTFNIGEAAASLQRRARTELHRYFSAEDYPGVAWSKNQSGDVRFVLLIDETGRVADCTVIETSGIAALDAQTCGVLKERAKFEPALGADGKPAKDAAVQRTRWKMSE